jgi:hypothetical protein
MFKNEALSLFRAGHWVIDGAECKHAPRSDAARAKVGRSQCRSFLVSSISMYYTLFANIFSRPITIQLMSFMGTWISFYSRGHCCSLPLRSLIASVLSKIQPNRRLLLWSSSVIQNQRAVSKFTGIGYHAYRLIFKAM